MSHFAKKHTRGSELSCKQPEMTAWITTETIKAASAEKWAGTHHSHRERHKVWGARVINKACKATTGCRIDVRA